MTNQLIPFPRAKRLLSKKFNATDDEVAMWVFMDEIKAFYENGQRMSFVGLGATASMDPIKVLAACSMDADELESFEPTWRYLTYEQLVKRWKGYGTIDEAEKLIHAKAAWAQKNGTGTLQSFHPRFDTDVKRGMYQLEHVEEVEKECFAGVKRRQSREKGPTAFAALIKRALEGERKNLEREPSAREVWAALSSYDEKEIIQELEADKVSHCHPQTGKEYKPTSFKAFENRLSDQRRNETT